MTGLRIASKKAIEEPGKAACNMPRMGFNHGQEELCPI
jgi:hypothetical protein